jgi:hypothetical protein
MRPFLLVPFLIMTTISFPISAIGAPPTSCSEAYSRCTHTCETRPSGKIYKCRGFCPAELESCKATGNWYGLSRQWTGLRRD